MFCLMEQKIRERSNQMTLGWVIVGSLLFGVSNLQTAEAALGTQETPIVERTAFFVVNCTQFQNALNSTAPSVLITIQQSLVCDEEQWVKPVTVSTNVTIVGLKLSGNVPIIDFGDSDRVIKVVGNHTLRFENLILLHNYTPTLGPVAHVPFVDTKNGSSVNLSEVIVTYRSCGESDDKGSTLINQDIGLSEVDLGPDFSGISLMDEVFNRNDGISVLVCECVTCCGQKDVETSIADLIQGAQSGQHCWLRVDVERSNFNRKTSGNSSDGNDDSKHVWIWVWTSVGLVALLLATIACLAFAFRRQRKVFLSTQQVKETSLDNITPTVLPPATTTDNMTFEAKMEKARQQALVPKIQNIDAGWSPELPFDHGLIRELPISERGEGLDTIGTSNSTASTLLFQLGGLEVELHHFLGKGGYSCVYKGSYKGEVVAVKIMEHDGSLLKTHGEPLEAYLNRNLVHPNVVRMLASRTCTLETVTDWWDKLQSKMSLRTADAFSGRTFSSISTNKPRGNQDIFNTFIVMEYCDGGTLAQAAHCGSFFIDADRNHPKMMLILMCALDIAYAMQHLHSQCVVHGDLKPENVLLQSASQDSRGFICKVGDFGLSRMMHKEVLIETLTVGTITHMPPELISKGALGVFTDVYSFGILLWTLISGSSPFHGLDHNEIVMNVVGGSRPPIPACTPPSYAKLIRECWQQNHENRPDFRVVTEKLRGIMFECMGLARRSWSAWDFPDRLERESTHERAQSFGSTRDGARIMGSTDFSTQPGRGWSSMASTQVEGLIGFPEAGWDPCERMVGSLEDLPLSIPVEHKSDSSKQAEDELLNSRDQILQPEQQVRGSTMSSEVLPESSECSHQLFHLAKFSARSRRHWRTKRSSIQMGSRGGGKSQDLRGSLAGSEASSWLASARTEESRVGGSGVRHWLFGRHELCNRPTGHGGRRGSFAHSVHRHGTHLYSIGGSPMSVVSSVQSNSRWEQDSQGSDARGVLNPVRSASRNELSCQSLEAHEMFKPQSLPDFQKLQTSISLQDALKTEITHDRGLMKRDALLTCPIPSDAGRLSPQKPPGRVFSADRQLSSMMLQNQRGPFSNTQGHSHERSATHAGPSGGRPTAKSPAPRPHSPAPRPHSPAPRPHSPAPRSNSPAPRPKPKSSFHSDRKGLATTDVRRLYTPFADAPPAENGVFVDITKLRTGIPPPPTRSQK